MEALLKATEVAHLVDQWQEYRSKAGKKKAECDEKFVLLRQLEEPERQISVETLYRKWAAIRAGDLDALVDKRGKARKGKTVLPPEIEQQFLSLYLDEAQLPIPRCVALTEQWARDNMPAVLPLPSYHTFYRKAKAVPYTVTVLCREGEKAYYPTITITADGAVTNPKIVKDGAFVRLIDTLAAGDTVVITTNPRSIRITKNGVNVLNKVDRASNFTAMQMQPGTNTVSYEADYGDNNLHVVIRYNKQYLGV